MKKFLLLFVFFVGILVLISSGNDCLKVDSVFMDEIEVGRLFAWDNPECNYKWNYTSKKNMVGFSIDDLKSKHDDSLLLQFAGPFTDRDGTTQGLSVEDGIFIESVSAGYSGLVLLDQFDVLDIHSVEGNAAEFFVDEVSGFEQALVVHEGKISEQVKNGWNMYKDNKPLNYRFLLKDDEGDIKLIDFFVKTGLKDSLDLLIEKGYREVVYLDIVGSELGYYFENGVYKKLGGVGAINLYNSKSPGGFLELYFE